MSILQSIVIATVFYTGTVSGLKCLSCTDVSHPQFCKQTVTCGNGETCQDYGNTIKTKAIHNPENVRLCLQCCHGDLCNSGGCGESNFYDLGKTVCYQCQYKLENEECTTIETCNSEEICYIEETRLDMHKYFTSGCRRKTLCDAVHNSGAAFGRRKRDSLCANCCDKFLCNKGCGNDQCVDQPECSSLISHYQVCRDNQTASEICPKSCGLCPSKTTTLPLITDCRDVSHNCEYLESKFHICQDSTTIHEIGCHKTCGLCDTSGTDFYLGFSQNYRGRSSHLVLYIVSEGNGEVNITIPLKSLQQTIVLQSRFVVYNVSSTIIPASNSKELKGLAVTSTVPIYLFATNYYPGTSDAFNVIPSQHLNTHYYIPSSNPRYSGSEYQSQMLLVSPYDNNNITISVQTSGSFNYDGHSYHDGSHLNIVMNRLETFELTHTHNLAGTKIISTKPLAVISGNICNEIIFGGCSHLSDMIPPINTYDTSFIIPKFSTQRLQIITAVNGTGINIVTNSSNNKHLQNTGDVMEINMTSTTVVSASNGILVSLFIAESSYGPSMMIVPGINQYLSNYTFAVPPGVYSVFYSNIIVVIQTSAIDGLFLDGKRLSHTTSSSADVGGKAYSDFVTSITPGFHNMYHEHGVTFGLFVRGTRWNDGFSFAAGKSLNWL